MRQGNVTDEMLREQLRHVIKATHFDFLGARYEGKVRDCYVLGDERVLVTSDRLSCFDVVVTTVPFKGRVLNSLAVHWFERTGHIIRNHVLDVPDPNVMIVRNVEILPVEVIVRAYLTGSAWRDYEAGRPVSGVSLPPGMRPSQQLPEIVLTPSTKAEKGTHDQPISEEEIVSRGLVEKTLWDEIREAARALFAFGQEQAAERGLILVDTKYEFGLLGGRLVLADEIHTLDSSRYWIAGSYRERFERGEPPEMLDKEPVRQWLLGQGYKGDGPVPHFSDEYRVQLARHYIDSFERISGLEFAAETGPQLERIESTLRAALE